ncbi:hypothetical protein [Sodalis sp.]
MLAAPVAVHVSEARIPVAQLSIDTTRDTAYYFAIGKNWPRYAMKV